MLTVKLTDILVSVRTKVVSLIFVQPQVKLRTVLNYRFIKDVYKRQVVYQTLEGQIGGILTADLKKAENEDDPAETGEKETLEEQLKKILAEKTIESRERAYTVAIGSYRGNFKTLDEVSDFLNQVRKKTDEDNAYTVVYLSLIHICKMPDKITQNNFFKCVWQ